MEKMNHIYIFLLLFFLGCVGCRKNDEIVLSSKNEVTIGAIDVMITINPLLAADGPSRSIHSEVWQTLNQFDPVTSHLMPVLASCPKILENGHRFSYTVDSRAKWSDGVPVTTEDIIFTFKSIQNQTAHVDGYRGDFADLDSVWSPIPSVVLFQFKRFKINREFDIAGIWILPKHKFDSTSATDQLTWFDLHSSQPSEAVREEP